ncbi:MAG TPA: aminopeptidase P family N-terminal domain-containing protein, partial [Thermoleophilia bacterium]|nr:aminopeptidase P family N-terminal domain-containing protein [Thermoleophilia bacterium]
MDDDPAPQTVEPRAALVPAAELQRRIAGLQEVLREQDLDAALLQQNADLYYYAGTVQQSYLYVPVEGQPTLFVRKVVARARRESALGRVVGLASVRDLPAAIEDRYGSLPARLGLELDVLPVLRFRRLEDLFPEAAFED